MSQFFLVGIGGGIGAMLRFLAGHILQHKNFPYATLLVNILGSLAIGYILSLSFKDADSKLNYSLLLATGLCGGFTTFSSFSFDNIQLLQQGKIGLALFYMIISLALCTFATYLGIKLNG